MLPENLTGSYLRYKQDTNYFLAWLDSVAKSCGPPKLVKAPTNKQKAKARKEEKKAAQQSSHGVAPKTTISRKTTTTADILEQTRLIAECKKPVIIVPVFIQPILKRAINARKQCALWFESIATQPHHTSNSNKDFSDTGRHNYFIRVLEDAYSLLEPRFAKPKPASNPNPRSEQVNQQQSSAKKEPSTQQSSPVNNDFTNRFEALEIEDIDEQAYEAMPYVTAETGPVITDLPGEDGGNPIHSDLPFKVFCFFEDMQKLRDFIGQLWKDVAAKRVAFETAALTTNVALETFHENDKVLMASLPEINTEPHKSAELHHYHKLLIIVSIAMKSSSGKLLSLNGPFLHNASIDDLINPWRSSPNMNQQHLNAFFHLFLFLCLSRFQTDCVFESWETGGNRLKPILNQIGNYWQFHNTKEVCKEEHAKIGVALLDLVSLRQIKSKIIAVDRAYDAGWLREEEGHVTHQEQRKLREHNDAITKYLLDILDMYIGFKGTEHIHGNVSASAVFASRVYLDIENIMGKTRNAECYRFLRQLAANYFSTMNIRFDNDDKDDQPNGVLVLKDIPAAWAQDKEMIDRLSQVLRSIKNTIMSPIMSAVKIALTKMDTMGADGGPELIHPDPNPTFYYESNPVYSGLETLKLQLRMEKAGVQAGKSCNAFACVAHLYNAFRQIGLISTNWDFMDQAINANMASLFFGSLPTDQQAMKRLYLCFGASSSSFAPHSRSDNRRTGTRVVVNEYKTRIAISQPWISTPLLHYLEGDMTSTNLLDEVYIETRKKKMSGRNRQLGILELLSLLKDNVQEGVELRNVDMITVSRDCNEVLKRMKEMSLERLGSVLGYTAASRVTEDDDFPDNPNTNSSFTMDVMAELHEREVAKESVSKKTANTQEFRDFLETSNKLTWLSVAVEVMKGFLSETNKVVAVEPIDVAKTSDFAFMKAISRNNGEKIGSWHHRVKDTSVVDFGHDNVWMREVQARDSEN